MKASSSSAPARSAAERLGAVSLFVKRLEQRVSLVDQLLNAVRCGILAALRRGDAQRDVRERRADGGDADPKTHPKERARKPRHFMLIEAVRFRP